MSDKISQQSQDEALAIANATKKPGQNKAQTKLIAAGIEKGIAVYKKQHKAKLREQDKKRKKSQRVQQQVNDNTVDEQVEQSPHLTTPTVKLPWVLLLLSWLGFASFIVFNQ